MLTQKCSHKIQRKERLLIFSSHSIRITEKKDIANQPEEDVFS